MHLVHFVKSRKGMYVDWTIYIFVLIDTTCSTVSLVEVNPTDRQTDRQKGSLNEQTLPLAVFVCLHNLFVYFLPRFRFDFIDFFHLLASVVLRVFSFDPQPLSAVLFYFICSSTVLFFYPQYSSFSQDFIVLFISILLFSCGVLFFA
jgi:hypothetical protein